MTEKTEINRGDVVEIWRKPTSITHGIVSNVEPERVLVQVHNIKPDGWMYTSDVDGIRLVVHQQEVTKNLGPAKAGWMHW